MFLNYFRTALRSISANRATALINILGLATGLCCFLCSLLYIRHELGYDAFFTKADAIYRVSIDSTFANGRQFNLAGNGWPMAELLPREFAQIAETTRLSAREVLLSTDELALYQNQFRLVDANFFSIFDLRWIEGDPATVLARPDSIVLTASLATRYFGDANPIGRQMLMDKTYPLVVSGVIADLPADTHLTGDAFASTALLTQIFDPATFLDNWNYVGLHTYFVLAPGADIAEVEEGMAAFTARYKPAGNGITDSMRITPLRDVYRLPPHRGTLKTPLNMALLYVLGSVAFAILLIACINFVNLTLARALTRAKEVGVRKSVGASRWQLLLQFVGEAVLQTALAMLLALLLMEILLPVISQFANRPLELALSADIGKLALLILVVGAGAGFFPALHLASFNAARATRNTHASGKTGLGLLKNSLVVFQFAVSIVLLVSTAGVMLQLQHMRTMDMGFIRDGVVTLQGSPAEGFGNRLDTLKRELLQDARIVSVTASDKTPFKTDLLVFGTRSSRQAEPIEMAHVDISYDFFATYGIDLLAGRDYSADFPGDMAVLEERLGAETSANFVINASAAAAHGWQPQEAIGQPFAVFIEDSFTQSGTVVGVVADSRFESSDTAIRPTVFRLTPSMLHWNYPTLEHVSLKLSGEDVAGALQFIDATWARIYPDMPVTRGFVSEDFEGVYISETRLSDALGALAFLALFIACLGLYSLAAFNAQRRVKEIGVRKVMGGSVLSIVWLLTSNFSTLVLVANLIAWPVAYFAMQRWLENFAYRMDLTPLVFIGSGLIALCIAWMTVGGTAAKAASARPVVALRYE